MHIPLFLQKGGEISEHIRSRHVVMFRHLLAGKRDQIHSHEKHKRKESRLPSGYFCRVYFRNHT